MYGANHAYAALEGKDRGNDRNYLVMGPWRHGQVKVDGRSLGALQWNGDTALQFRRDILRPFFDQSLISGAPKADTQIGSAACRERVGQYGWISGVPCPIK